MPHISDIRSRMHVSFLAYTSLFSHACLFSRIYVSFLACMSLFVYMRGSVVLLHRFGTSLFSFMNLFSRICVSFSVFERERATVGDYYVAFVGLFSRA